MTTNRLSVPLLCMYLVLVHEGGGERWIKRTYRSLGPVLVTVNMAIPFLARAVAGRPMLGQSMFTAFIVLLVPFLTAGWLSVVILCEPAPPQDARYPLILSLPSAPLGSCSSECWTTDAASCTCAASGR